MRIIAGEYKGFPLVYPKDQGFRPTQEKVKAAIFNILKETVSNAVFLDLCCGTGGMGLEALSRGASFATFVDLDTEFVAKNRLQILDRVGNDRRSEVDRQIRIVRSSIAAYLRRETQSMDVIFLDPPWDHFDVYREAFLLLSTSSVLAQSGVLVCEHPKQLPLELPVGLRLGPQYFYRRTVVSLIYKE